MMLKGVHIKKRYIAGVLVVLFLLVKCSGSDDDEQQPQAKPISMEQYSRNDGYQDTSVNDPTRVQFNQPAPQAAQPVIINNQPAQNSNDGFLTGLIWGHLMSGGGSRGGDYSSSHHTVVNKTIVQNHYTQPQPAKAAPAPVAQRTTSSFSTSYSTPAPRTMTRSNGYSRPASSFRSSYRSTSRSYSFRSRR
ncbi:TPA: hypothetical protein I9Y37_001840 [Citrobacter freundii]|nr:hypothetical protein [Citrobacter freundii]HAT3963818.1 hypothetical protein [Citrobacter freundii]